MSSLPGFYRLSPPERRRIVAELAHLDAGEISALDGGLSLDQADTMIENVVGVLAVPIGIATNFIVDGIERLVPMAVEEPSVVAAASNGAKVARQHGGFVTEAGELLQTAQIQLVDLEDPQRALTLVAGDEKAILERANESDPMLLALGGGAKSLETRLVVTERETMLVCHLLVDCRDAMGANAVNTMAEHAAPLLESLTGGRASLRIISNLADRRLVTSSATFDDALLGTEESPGELVLENILAAYRFARHDPYRATTNNKGVMNGVASVALATGNDTRAVQAGGHAYASTASEVGHYSSLTRFERDENGNLAGRLTLPMAVGIVGGATSAHPAAKACLKILGVESGRELAGVMVSVGLAQQFAAMWALATVGIQRGHMRLHARSVAMSAGARGGEVDQVAAELARRDEIRADAAADVLRELRRKTRAR